MPFSGVMGIFDMIIKKGFYVNEASYARSYTISGKLGLDAYEFLILNKLIALLYFGSLIVIALSPFFKMKLKKKSILVSIVFFVTLCVLILIPQLINWA